MKKFRKDTGTKSALPSGRPTDFGKAGARETRNDDPEERSGKLRPSGSEGRSGGRNG
jgi:hypothetical protein